MLWEHHPLGRGFLDHESWCGQKNEVSAAVIRALLPLSNSPGSFKNNSILWTAAQTRWIRILDDRQVCGLRRCLSHPRVLVWTSRVDDDSYLNDSHSTDKAGSPESHSTEIILENTLQRWTLSPRTVYWPDWPLSVLSVNLHSAPKAKNIAISSSFCPHFLECPSHLHCSLACTKLLQTCLFYRYLSVTWVVVTSLETLQVQRAPKWIKTQTQILGVFMLWPAYHHSLFKVSLWICLG